MFIALLFIVAISIAGVAAYFSITGLVAVFSASALAIIIMGTVLEVGKLMAISYGYRYWNIIGGMQKSFLLFFVILLMIITSIGIFGFLSKAHLEKVGPQEQYALTIERVEEKIALEEDKIDRGQRVLDNLDAALDRYIELGYVTRGLEQREEQSEQRSQVESMIAESESKIDKLNEQRSEMRSSIQEIELEVGPIKYIAEMLYGDGADAIDKAVKILIIMLVCTFDPLAVMLLISANHAHMHRNDDRIRSEFSILDKNKEPVQSDDLLYDDLTDEEKEDHIRKVRDYLKELDETDESHTASKKTEDKYRDMFSKNENDEVHIDDVEEIKNDVNDNGSEQVESPYKLHNLDKPQKNRLGWLPKKKK